MFEHLRKWIFAHSTVLAFHCFGVVVALVAGIVLGNRSWGEQVSAVLAAFLGAAVTVFGAVAYGEHQESRRKEEAAALNLKRRRDMIQICFDFLRQIGLSTTTAMGYLDEGRPVSFAIRPVLAQWETVSAFEPFREVEDFFQMRAMLQIGAKCRNLAGYSTQDTPHERDANHRLLNANDGFGSTAASAINAIECDCRRELAVFHATLEELDAALRASPAT